MRPASIGVEDHGGEASGGAESASDRVRWLLRSRRGSASLLRTVTSKPPGLHTMQSQNFSTGSAERSSASPHGRVPEHTDEPPPLAS